MLLLQERSNKFEQENKFMAEALEDLQDSTSRLEAENRTLKMGASPKGRIGGGSGSSGKVRGVRLGCTPSSAYIFCASTGCFLRQVLTVSVLLCSPLVVSHTRALACDAASRT